MKFKFRQKYLNILYILYIYIYISNKKWVVYLKQFGIKMDGIIKIIEE